MYDDDALDRALAALPLEEPPADLHARIMAATAEAPVAAALPLPGWEVWLAALLSSLALWLAWIFVTTPHAVERLTFAIDRLLVQTGGLNSASTVLWVAVGISAAWWVTQISIPQPQAQKIRPR